MALIGCPECKKKISETAAGCPHCGYALSASAVKEIKEKEQLNQIITVVIMIVGTIIGLFSCVDYSSSPTRSTYRQPTPTETVRRSTLTREEEQLKSLPALRGYTDSEKETIIRAARDLDQRVQDLERRRGY